MFAAGEVQNYKRVLELADSLEAEGDITSQNANRWRGVAYYHQKQMRSAEVYYKKVVESDIKSESDELNYYKSARRLATLLLKKATITTPFTSRWMPYGSLRRTTASPTLMPPC